MHLLSTSIRDLCKHTQLHTFLPFRKNFYYLLNKYAFMPPIKPEEFRNENYQSDRLYNLNTWDNFYFRIPYNGYNVFLSQPSALYTFLCLYLKFTSSSSTIIIVIDSAVYIILNLISVCTYVWAYGWPLQHGQPISRPDLGENWLSHLQQHPLPVAHKLCRIAVCAWEDFNRLSYADARFFLSFSSFHLILKIDYISSFLLFSFLG